MLMVNSTHSYHYWASDMCHLSCSAYIFLFNLHDIPKRLVLLLALLYICV